MRPEEFDNRLHQKLDELNPVFNEQDWMRLSKKMNASKSPALFTKRISMILLLLFLVLFSAWMTIRWSSITPDSQIQDDIQNGGMNTPVLAEISKPGSRDNSDKNSLATGNIENATQAEVINSTALTQTVISSTVNARTKNPNYTKSNLTKKQFTSNGYSKNSKANILSVNNKYGNSPSTNKSGTEEKPVLEEAKVQDQNAIKQFSENGIAENVKLNVENHSLENQISKDENGGFSLVDPIQLLASKGLLINDKTSLGSRIKPVVGLKPYKWVVGATGVVVASHFNTGLVFEIKTKKSISFGSGLIVQKYLEQDYLDQNEFAVANEADFTDLIRPRHSKSISFSNIKIKSMDVLLPLSLKYYFPLNTRFALFANASMQLTLYSKTTLDFQSITQDKQILNVSDFDQASNSATLINHFTIGGGLQREFKHFVIQTGFLVQKNNSNQPQITKQEMAGQISILYKL